MRGSWKGAAAAHGIPHGPAKEARQLCRPGQAGRGRAVLCRVTPAHLGQRDALRRGPAQPVPRSHLQELFLAVLQPRLHGTKPGYCRAACGAWEGGGVQLGAPCWLPGPCSAVGQDGCGTAAWTNCMPDGGLPPRPAGQTLHPAPRAAPPSAARRSGNAAQCHPPPTSVSPPGASLGWRRMRPCATSSLRMPGREAGRCVMMSCMPMRCSLVCRVTKVRAAVASRPCTRLRKRCGQAGG